MKKFIENIMKKTIKNRPEILQKRGLGGSGGLLGVVLESFWLPGPPATATGWQTLVRWTPFGRLKGSLWGPIFDNVRDSSVFFRVVFSKRCFEGFWALFLIVFQWFSGLCFMFFLCVSGASSTKDNVVSIHYLLCFKHITLFEKGDTIQKLDTFLRTYLGRALVLDLGAIFSRFWELFGTLQAHTCRK